MMRKILLPVTLTVFCFALFPFIIFGCASAPEAKETKSITELWEPVHQPDFVFEPFLSPDTSAEYTVAVIDLDFSCEYVPEGECVASSLEQEYRGRFVEAFSDGFKRMLTAKGMIFKGPYPSYDDISFVVRSDCDFVLKPRMFLEFERTRSTIIEELTNYGGPHGEPRMYGMSRSKLTATAQLEYEVIDPRTREELDRHVLRSGMLSRSYDQLWSQWTMIFGKNSRTGWRELEYRRRRYPNYHNADNATGKILEDVYHYFMPRLDGMLSAKEFEMFEGRKRESANRN